MQGIATPQNAHDRFELVALVHPVPHLSTVERRARRKLPVNQLNRECSSDSNDSGSRRSACVAMMKRPARWKRMATNPAPARENSAGKPSETMPRMRCHRRARQIAKVTFAPRTSISAAVVSKPLTPPADPFILNSYRPATDRMQQHAALGHSPPRHQPPSAFRRDPRSCASWGKSTTLSA